MELSNEKLKEYTKRLLLSRMRILCNNGFYGLLLMHMGFGIDANCETAYTDSYKIAFNPNFLEGLNDNELDFVMMHEILHVVLQHCFRGADYDQERFNIACDIVVNSNILLSNDMDKSSITLRKYGESMHLAPDGKEGHNYTAEQVYQMLSSNKNKKKKKPSDDGFELGRSEHEQGKKDDAKDSGGSFDDHSHWGTVEEEDDTMRDVWVKRLEDACEAIEVRSASKGRGRLPLFAQRLLKELRNPQTDWRTILNEFVQEEIVDYSFTPPDRRFDGPFFLPDFNGKDDMVENVLFMIDTSGSMSDDMITAAYSEVKGAIDQFNGKLKGWLGFFDAAVIEPKPFENEDEFKVIKAAGGGGTDFQIIFEYVQKYMQDNPPVSIIILTDGYAPFPKEHLAGGIPVLWLLNNEEVEPPWGKVARITV